MYRNNNLVQKIAKVNNKNKETNIFFNRVFVNKVKS